MHKSVVLVEQRLAQLFVMLCTVRPSILKASVTVTGRQGVLCPLTGVAELVRVKLRYTLPAHVESELAYSLQLKVRHRSMCRADENNRYEKREGAMRH